MPLTFRDDHDAHLSSRLTQSEITVAITVEHLDDDLPSARDVATAIRDGLHSSFFSAKWPNDGWSIEKITGGP